MDTHIRRERSSSVFTAYYHDTGHCDGLDTDGATINIVFLKILDIYCSTIQSSVLCMQQA